MDGVTGGAKGDDSLVRGCVRCATCIFAGRLGELDSLALPFAPGFIVVASHL
jgi:hypothetical protein